MHCNVFNMLFAPDRARATHCNTLQHTATYCNVLQHMGTHCNTLQHVAACYNTLHLQYIILCNTSFAPDRARTFVSSLVLFLVISFSLSSCLSFSLWFPLSFSFSFCLLFSFSFSLSFSFSFSLSFSLSLFLSLSLSLIFSLLSLSLGFKQAHLRTRCNTQTWGQTHRKHSHHIHAFVFDIPHLSVP